MGGGRRAGEMFVDVLDVPDGDGVIPALDDASQARTDAPAADDDHMHGWRRYSTTRVPPQAAANLRPVLRWS